MISYRPKPGAHILVAEARVIGDAMERYRASTHRRDIPVPAFERFCRTHTRHPVHSVWEKYRNRYRNAAGREAAAYMLRSVYKVEITNADGGHIETAGAEKAGPIVLHSVRGTSIRTGVAHRPGDIRRNPNLLEDVEAQFKSTIRGHMKSAGDLLGLSRMRRAVMEVLREFVAAQRTG